MDVLTGSDKRFKEMKRKGVVGDVETALVYLGSA